MVALEHDRTGGPFIAVERAAGDARNRLPVDDALAVEHDRHDATNERYVHLLPFAGFFCGIDRGRKEAVDAADIMRIRLQAVIVLNLNLVSPTQVDAAVASFGIAELGVKL